jgi:pimeloyl-ACP methyl ester carboxylesterase
LAVFAGEPRIEAPFLETVRKGLAKYIRKNKLDKPVIVGHSSGGFLALWLAEQEPDLAGPLVIVDTLPFLAGVIQPNATAESMKKNYQLVLSDKARHFVMLDDPEGFFEATGSFLLGENSRKR